MEKTCKICGNKRHAKELCYKHYARVYRAEYFKRYYLSNRDEKIEYQKKWEKENHDHVIDYRRTWSSENKDKILEWSRRYIEKHKNDPDFKKKMSARYLANKLIKTKKPCSDCGGTVMVERHHDDYDKPLDIKWLCRWCHIKVHHNKTI